MTRPDEIEKHIKSCIKMVNTNTQLLNTNQLKQNKCNSLNQETYASNFFNNKSIANLDLENKYIDLPINKLFNPLTIKAEDNLQSKKLKKQRSKINTAK